MKRLEFSNETKEIKIIESEVSEESKVEIGRRFLKRNKIYFETVLISFLTAMSIIISIVAITVDINIEKINEREVDIMETERPPFFELSFVVDKTTLYDSRLSYAGTYFLRNRGGFIKDEECKLTSLKIFSIGNFKFSIEIFPDNTGFSFDQENNEVLFYYCSWEKIADNIKEKLEEKFDNYVFYDKKDYLQIEYTDYKNEHKVDYYKINYDSIYRVKEKDIFECNEHFEILDFDDIDSSVTEIEKVIKKNIQ